MQEKFSDVPKITNLDSHKELVDNDMVPSINKNYVKKIESNTWNHENSLNKIRNNKYEMEELDLKLHALSEIYNNLNSQINELEINDDNINDHDLNLIISKLENQISKTQEIINKINKKILDRRNKAELIVSSN